MTPFKFFPEDLWGLAPFEELLMHERGKKRKRDRCEVGDFLGKDFTPSEMLIDEKAGAYPCFNTLFQGDDLGVEFALQGHENLLVGEGLLQEENRIRDHYPLPLSCLWEVLIIDDDFVLGTHEKDLPKETSCFSSACPSMSSL